MAQRFDSILWLFVVATILMGFLELISHSILAFAYLMSAGLVYCCGFVRAYTSGVCSTLET